MWTGLPSPDSGQHQEINFAHLQGEPNPRDWEEGSSPGREEGGWAFASMRELLGMGAAACSLGTSDSKKAGAQTVQYLYVSKCHPLSLYVYAVWC